MTTLSTTLAGAAPVAGAPARRDPATRLIRWRLVQVGICLGVVALPLLKPSGPGNTGLVDVALLGAVLVSALWAATRAYQLRLPYAVPVGLSVIAGALALTATTLGIGMNSGAAVDGTAAQRGGLALMQDLFVLGWAAAVATIGQDRRLLDTLLRAWSYSAAAWAAILIIGDIFGLDWITGIGPRDGIRASLTLGDPNLAANYFLIGLLITRAARRPRRTVPRWIACALIVTGVVLTLSNGGILAMLIVTVLGWLFALAHRRGLLVAVTAALALAVAGGTVAATVNVHTWVVSAEQASPLVRDSIGRQSESGGSRSTLLREGLGLWLSHDAWFGLGPANTESTLRAHQAPYVKESHDDYMAALLERGILGGMALTLLGLAVLVRCRRISRRDGVPPDLLRVIPRPELLAAAAVAVAISGLFYETLHFRHVWALFGVIAAVDIASGARVPFGGMRYPVTAARYPLLRRSAREPASTGELA